MNEGVPPHGERTPGRDRSLLSSSFPAQIKPTRSAIDVTRSAVVGVADFLGLIAPSAEPSAARVRFDNDSGERRPAAGTPATAAATAASIDLSEWVEDPRVKTLQIRQSYYIAATLSLIGVTTLLLYHNYVIFASFLRALLWAFLLSIPLGSWRHWLSDAVLRTICFFRTQWSDVPLVVAVPWAQLLCVFSAVNSFAVLLADGLRRLVGTTLRHLHGVAVSALLVVVASGWYSLWLLDLFDPLQYLARAWHFYVEDMTWLLYALFALWLLYSVVLFRLLPPAQRRWRTALFVALMLPSVLPLLCLHVGGSWTFILLSVVGLLSLSAMFPPDRQQSTDQQSTQSTQQPKQQQQPAPRRKRSSSRNSPPVASDGSQLKAVMSKWLAQPSSIWFLLLYSLCACWLLYRHRGVLIDLVSFNAPLLLLLFFSLLLLCLFHLVVPASLPFADRLSSGRRAFAVALPFAPCAPEVLFLVALPLRGLLNIDRRVLLRLEQWRDFIVTVFLLVASLLIFVAVLLFFAVQAHRETVYVVEISTRMWNDDASPVIGGWLEGVRQHPQFNSTVQAVSSWVQQKVDEVVKDVFGPGTDLNKLLATVGAVFGGGASSSSTTTTTTTATTTATGGEQGYLTGVKDALVNFNTESLALLYSHWASEMKGLFQALFLQGPAVLASIVFSVVQKGFDVLLSLGVFVTALFLFLSSGAQGRIVGSAMNTLVPESQIQTRMTKRMSDVVKQTIASTLKVAWFQFLLSWLTLSFFDFELVCIPAVISALLSIPVFIPSYAVAVPFAMQLWVFEQQIVSAVVFFLLHFATYFWVVPQIQMDIETANPYIIGLAIVGGITAFGMEGVLIGPLLVSVLVIAFDGISMAFGTEPPPQPVAAAASSAR